MYDCHNTCIHLLNNPDEYADPPVDVHGEQAGGRAGGAEAAAGPHLHPLRGRGRGAGALRARARLRHRRLAREAPAAALQGCQYTHTAIASTVILPHSLPFISKLYVIFFIFMSLYFSKGL